MKETVPIEAIEGKILLIRGRKVMLDSDLAELYGVATKVLNQAVKRNERRFPPDFMFRLTKLKHSSALPHVFTGQGLTMLSSVLNSERAIQVNVQIGLIYGKVTPELFNSNEL